VERRVRELLGDTVWGEDADEFAEVALAALRTRGATLATMESLTGGLLGDLLTSVAGASTVYRGGVVAYHVQTKAAFGVPQPLLEAHGSVSPEAALAMAKAAAERVGADYGLATTGVAGPDTAEGKPVGEVHLALYRKGTDEGVHRRLQFPPLERNWVRERAAFAALALLWRALREARVA
jgi:nicotinamide-nucleotide amidase